MTAEELRKIDLEIAEKVMGWQWFPDIRGTGQEILDIVPHYTTDISAAWQVVNEILEDDDMDEDPFSLHRSYSNKAGAPFNFWKCTICLCGQSYSYQAQTAPLAICLAALNVLKK